MILTSKLVNGYRVLVDEKAEIKEDDICFFDCGYAAGIHKYDKSGHIEDWNKIIFADPELGFDLPVVPDWEKWEVGKMAIQCADNISRVSSDHWMGVRTGFHEGHNANKAKWTDEDLRKAMDYASRITNNRLKYIEDYIQSLQKLPKVIEVEEEENGIVINKKFPISVRSKVKLKLITNSKGLKEPVIKNVIWE